MTTKAFCIERILLLFALFLLAVSCGIKEPDFESSKSFARKDIENIIVSKHKYEVLLGNLFSDSNCYSYFFYPSKGKHLIFKLDQSRKIFVKVFEVEGGVGSKEASFRDCNFDSVKDVLINVDAGGNYDEEIRIIFLKKGDAFVEVKQQISYPIFDLKNNLVLSRYQGPNDSNITIEKYKWNNDTLKLIDKQYMSDSGNLEEAIIE